MRYIFLLLILFSCTSNEKMETFAAKTDIEATSELAQLMRVMEAHGDATRKAIRAGETLPEALEGIERLTTARATIGMHIDQQTFPVFARDYQAKVEV